MKIYSNYRFEDKTYDTEKDIEEIKELIDSTIASDRNAICSTGTLIKIKRSVKFQDGTLLTKGQLFTLEDERNAIIQKIKELEIAEVRGKTLIIKNEHGHYSKEYYCKDDFEAILGILDFLNLIEKCEVYELEAVSNNRNLAWEKRRLGEKCFLVGEEKELIEWAVKNQIWGWLKEITE